MEESMGSFRYFAGFLVNPALELIRTAVSLCGALRDLITLSFFYKKRKQKKTFAFLVHPRTSEFNSGDVYGSNDVFRPFPALCWLNYFFGTSRAKAIILKFSRWIVPITLSKITVRLNDGTKRRGYLLSTVRVPEQLLGSDIRDTRPHLARLFKLAGKKGVERVGLGALLPSMTGYGKKLIDAPLAERPAVSTGHAYTAYTIVEFLRFLTDQRNKGEPVVRVAIMGAAGSTGKATLSLLMRLWDSQTHLDLTLVDVEKKQFALNDLVKRARESNVFSGVRSSVKPEILQEAEYVIVVTNASQATVKPEHLTPGTVVIDDSQPRNTGIELVQYGVHVIDVLARVPGLDVGFDFGFQTRDKTVTFTCLAETVLAAAVGEEGDLALGDVSPEVVERVIRIAEKAERLGLIGRLPFFSFGREMTMHEVNKILNPPTRRIALPAE